MKTADQKLLLGLVFAMAACFPALPQTRVAPATPGAASGGSASATHGGAGYFSGGERGSVVQVVRDAEVQAELNLSQEQRQQITDILVRVQAMEAELFDEFRRNQQAHIDAGRTRTRMSVICWRCS